MKRWLVLCGGFTIVVFAAAIVDACTIATQTYEVPTTFPVWVKRESQSFADIAVKIYRFGDNNKNDIVFQKGRTDRNGYFRVSGLAPGTYWLSVGANTRFGNIAGLDVRVSPTHKSVSTVEMDWIEGHLIRTTGLRGTLRDQILDNQRGEFVVGEALGDVELRVNDASNGSYVARSVTDASGWFDLSKLSPGTYAVTVKPGRKTKTSPESFGFSEEGVFPLVVMASGSADEPVELLVSSTGCGLAYQARPKT